MLYLVPTPIGNLDDFSKRAIDTLHSVDLILCEDTRLSRRLLDHYAIKKPLKSYHKFNEKEVQAEILAKLKSGQQLALISDAGTPAINDPGALLVQACKEQNLPVSALPGPSAPITALVMSGLRSDRFQFVGFLPRKESALRHLFFEMVTYSGTSIAFEAPTRLEASLKILVATHPHIKVAMARELTKIYEECLVMTAQELLAVWTDRPKKGEICLLIEGKDGEKERWLELGAAEHVQLLQKEYGLTKQEAIKAAASLRGTPKSIIYRETLEK